MFTARQRGSWPRPEDLLPQQPWAHGQRENSSDTLTKRMVLVSWQGFALGAVPLSLAVISTVLVFQNWDWALFAIGLVGAIGALATGFPWVVITGRNGIWRLSGLLSWNKVHGVGITRTFNVTTDGFETGNLVPLLAVTAKKGMRWVVVRELRSTGTTRAELGMKRRTRHLSRDGSIPTIDLPLEFQPFLL